MTIPLTLMLGSFDVIRPDYACEQTRSCANKFAAFDRLKQNRSSMMAKCGRIGLARKSVAWQLQMLPR